MSKSSIAAKSKTKKKTSTVKAHKSTTTKNLNPKKQTSAIVDSIQNPRILKKPKYKHFKVHKKIKLSQPKISSGYKLFRASLKTLRMDWKLFGGILAVYAILTLVLVRGFASNVDITGLKGVYNQTFSAPETAAALLGSLVMTGNGASSESGSVYQSLLLVIISLATIWALRQTKAGQKLRVRDSFYKGLYPLVPLILVLLVIGLQLVPMAIGGWLYGVVINGGIAGLFIEKLLWTLLVLMLSVLSLYMISSSIFALYIVTLPDMTPMRALRSARQLVAYRRWIILRKILFLPLSVFIIGAIIMLPALLIVPVIAEWIFFALSLLGWIVTLSYIYTLYRELLNE